MKYKALKFIIENNKGNYNAYHNFEHLLTVNEHTIKICKIEIPNFEQDENLKLIMELASLFHDFNHTGVKGDDQININLAIKGFTEFYKLNENDILIEQKDEIIRLIQFTKFPHIEVLNDQLINIIRDADMCSTLNDNSIFTTVFGLAKEFNIDIKQQLKNQIVFVSNLKFNTNYCNHIWNNIFNNKLRELKRLDNKLSI